MLKKRVIADDAYVPREIVEEYVPNLPTHPHHLQRWIDAGFPAPIRLGHRTKVWSLAKVRAYMAKKDAEANALNSKNKKGGRR